MSRPISPRIDTTVLKDRSASDKAQVPATDATVSSATALQPGQQLVQVQVFNVGQIAPNDTVLVNGGQVALTVVSIAGGATLVVTNNNALAVDGATARESAYLSRDRVDYEVAIPLA